MCKFNEAEYRKYTSVNYLIIRSHIGLPPARCGYIIGGEQINSNKEYR